MLRGVPKLWTRYVDALDGMTALAGKTLLVPVPIVAVVGA